MSFFKKYELVKLIREDEAKTFEAREKASGRGVHLHLLENFKDRRSLDELLASLKRVEAAGRRPGEENVVEIGEFAGSYFVVTDVIENFAGLRPWAEARQPQVRAGTPPPQPRKIPPITPAPPAARPGEFTRLFGAGETPAGSAPPAQPPTPSRSPARSPAGGAEKGGAFTRLFGSAPSPAGDAQSAFPPPATPPATPPAGAGKPPAAPSGRGEFTRMFGQETPAAETPAASAPPGKKKKGIYTKLFGSSPGAAGEDSFPGSFGSSFSPAVPSDDPLAPGPDAAPVEVPKGKPFQAPGEFTRMFGPSDEAEFAALASSEEAAASEGAASGLFANPTRETPEPKTDEEAAGKQQQEEEEPGEYTLLVDKNKEARSEASAAPAAAEQTASDDAGAKSSRKMMIIVIVLAVVTVISIGTTLYLLLSRPEAAAPPAESQTIEAPETESRSPR